MSDGPATLRPTRTASKLADPMIISVVALGFTQIISWGTTLYALGVLGKPIAAETGWGSTYVFGGLTIGLLVSGFTSRWIGREIDKRGARTIMSIGSILVAIGLAALAYVPNATLYLAVWAFLGLAMRMTLYDAAFAALVQVTPSRGRSAISYLTLFGGLASSTFWPIGDILNGMYGWRTTFLIFAAINLLVCLPLHWFGLARRDDTEGGSTPAGTNPAGGAAGATEHPVLTGRTRQIAMVLFGVVMAASAFCFGAMAVHLVTVIGAAGVTAAAAVWLASIKGVAQSIARLLDIIFGKSLHPITLGRITLAILPLSLGLLMLPMGGLAFAFVFTIMFGAANGLTTIVRGSVPLALFGPKGYGEVLGILATPYLVLNALAPMIFAVIAEKAGLTWAMGLVTLSAVLAWVSIEVMARWYKQQGSAAPSAA